MRWFLIVLMLCVIGRGGPGRADELEDLARLDDLITLGRAADAVAWAESLLASPRLSARYEWQVRQRLGAALLAADRPAEAIPILEAALAAAPDDPALHLNLGRALRETGRRGRAVAEFGHAVDLAPDRWLWRLEFAEVMAELGIRRDALAQIRLARASCDDCPEALRGEANHFLSVGDAAGSVEPLRALHALRPDRDVRRLLARALSALDDPVAVAALLDTVPIGDLDAGEVMDLLQADRRLLRSERAIAWARGDALPGPAGWQPGGAFWAIVAEVCLAADRPAEALAAIDRALVLEPEAGVYHHNRAAILGRLGREADARRALEEARRRDPSLGPADGPRTD
ncbi:MAG TPA: tetratricopeptide repeat protein [Candidatus Krumholzibacteria bacterium]|nr:tetratricopeptide repeat protein [Candidatus Krumholzibacteria bacterium]HPD71194.1 tetratricopeptide repeat protein [Candidatus Krumholzibacteria bacterium]HRY39106.1 tetratricopeptide repeat protein [Candidatus Krumholzibacteria bacterium]